MSHSRAGAISSSDGSSARTEMSRPTWSLSFPVQPCATAVAPSIRAIATRCFAMSGRAERRGERISVLVNRARLQRGQDVVARELLARVDHVRADGADRKRPLAHVGQLLSLAEVERHGDDFGAVFLGQPAESPPTCRVRPSTPEQFASSFLPERLRWHPARRGASHLVRSTSSFTAQDVRQPSRRFESPAASGALRQITRIVSSPAIVPTISGRPARSIATASGCAWPVSVFSTTS